VRQQQELACLPHPAIDASAALFEEDLRDPFVIFTPYDPPHVVIGYDEEGELKASVEPLAEGEDPPDPKRAPITYTFLNESGEPAPLKLTMKEDISQFAERVTSFTTHIVARSRIPPPAAEPMDTSPVIDVEALSDDSSVESIGVLARGRRSSAPLELYSDSSDQEEMAPAPDTKLTKQCSVSLSRLDDSVLARATPVRSKSSPSTLSQPIPSTSAACFRIPKRKSTDISPLGSYKSPLEDLPPQPISAKFKALREEGKKEKERIEARARKAGKPGEKDESDDRKEKRAARKQRLAEKEKAKKREKQKEIKKRVDEDMKRAQAKAKEGRKARMEELFGKEPKKVPERKGKVRDSERIERKDRDRENVQKDKVSGSKEKNSEEKIKSKNNVSKEKDREIRKVAEETVSNLVDDVVAKSFEIMEVD